MSMLLAVLMIFLPSGPARSQEDVSDFTQTFQVFMQSRDAFRLFDISAEDVVYALPLTYQLGPGDIVQVILTGMIADALVVQVGPQGDIFVPPAGLLEVEGMTVQEARDYVDGELGKYLLNYHCALQLLKAKRIKVYLLGQVRQPGQYIALAGTSAVSLIQTAGSLVTNPLTVNFDERTVTHPYFRALTSGAGRWVEIWRKGERVGRLDLARVAIRGFVEGDAMLEDGDAVYVTANSHPVVVRGGVSRPGTYEMRQGDTVLDLLAQAGGYKSMMMLGAVDVERQNPAGSETPTTKITLNLADSQFRPKDFEFQPGDILRVPEVRDQVYVLGAVWMPQPVDFHEGWNALDYIAATGGPVAPTDTSSIRIISFPMTDQQGYNVLDMKSLILGGEVQNVPIEPGDMIYVPWKNQPFYGVGTTNAIATILGQTLGILRIINDLGG